MSTKKRCFDLAEKHEIEIYIHKNFWFEYSLSCPKGYQIEDFDGARTGLSASGMDSMKEVWREVYSDLKTMVSMKPWHKVSEGWE
jgi:hypothetical protein